MLCGEMRDCVTGIFFFFAENFKTVNVYRHMSRLRVFPQIDGTERKVNSEVIASTRRCSTRHQSRYKKCLELQSSYSVNCKGQTKTVAPGNSELLPLFFFFVKTYKRLGLYIFCYLRTLILILRWHYVTSLLQIITSGASLSCSEAVLTP
jgi:hypothetical protein